MICCNRRSVCILLITLIMFLKPAVAAQQQQLDIKAPTAILMDASTGKVLFEKNPHQKMEPASITKIMTLVVVFESLDLGEVKLSDIIKISDRAWGTGGSQVFLGLGEEQTLETLLKCIVVASANDASVAVAEHVGGSVEGFVKLMNNKAKELGMHNTNFTNPHGLSSPKHYTTAYDTAIVSRKLIEFPLFFKWSTIWMDYLEHTDKKRDATMLANTNKLIGKYEGLDGLKTGFHSKAGHCFAGTAKRGDFRLISVVLNANENDQRFEDSIKMFDYGFENYDSVKIVEKGMVQKSVPVEKGYTEIADIIVHEDVNVLVEKGKDSELNTKIIVPEKLLAPLKKNQVVGTLTVEQNGEIVKKVDMVIPENIEKANFIQVLKKILSKLLYI